MPIWMSLIEWLARAVLMGLFGLSIWSVAIILDRRKALAAADCQNFLETLKKRAQGFSTQKVEQALAGDMFRKRQDLEKSLHILGTLGSTAPFIGLLGTVLGIIVAFGELSMGKGDTNAIMFALAEALILTAVGLFVAIPAVIAFNHFKKKIKVFFDEVKSEIQVFLAEKKDS